MIGALHSTGTLILMIYSSTIYGNAGLDPAQSGYVSIGLNCGNLISSLLLSLWIHKVFLKKQLLIGMGVQIISLFLIAILSYFPGQGFQWTAIFFTFVFLFGAQQHHPISLLLPGMYRVVLFFVHFYIFQSY